MRIVLFGGSFNPPGIHHQHLAQKLAERFDRVAVVPCGPRPDKPSTNHVEPIHRAVMADMTFDGMHKVTVDLSDLERDEFRRMIELDHDYQIEGGEVWHAVGADLVRGGAKGESVIQREWRDGERVWNESRFAVMERAGFSLDAADLPPNSEVIRPEHSGSSSHIRELIWKGLSISDYVPAEAAAYIARYRLYSGQYPVRTATYNFRPDEDYLVNDLEDSENPAAASVAEALGVIRSSQGFHRPPERGHIFRVIGGDGHMLAAIRSLWRRRKPFLGVNAGRRGFLLNRPEDVLEGKFKYTDFRIHLLPMLYVEVTDKDGSVRRELAFNDAWIERASGQAMHAELRLDGVVRIPDIFGDGLLVSTASGTTGYAHLMGALPLVATAESLVLAGWNVNHPREFRPGPISMQSRVEFAAKNIDKRPARAFADSRLISDNAVRMFVRTSRIAAAEIMFTPNMDLAEKHARILFSVS